MNIYWDKSYVYSVHILQNLGKDNEWPTWALSLLEIAFHFRETYMHTIYIDVSIASVIFAQISIFFLINCYNGGKNVLSIFCGFQFSVMIITKKT
jgi:hypothetical protein